MTEDTSFRLSVTIDAPAEHAFAVFTEHFDEIKPHEHNLLSSPIARTVFEPRVGGTIHDIGEDGSVCAWGRVLEFEPPTRVVFSWDISPRWQLETDPARTSEVEVRFTAEAPERTRVDLEHRHLDRHGDGWEGFLGLQNAGGWPLYLERYQAVVERLDRVG